MKKVKPKLYLIGITSERGVTANIAVNSDSTPFIIHYCGSQYGNNYKTLGHCSKHLETIAAGWDRNNVKYVRKYGTILDLPISGSNIGWFKYCYYPAGIREQFRNYNWL